MMVTGGIHITSYSYNGELPDFSGTQVAGRPPHRVSPIFHCSILSSAQNAKNSSDLSLLLAEYPPPPKYGVYPSTPSSDDGGDMVPASARLRLKPKSTSVFKSGGLTPFSALTTCSVYSQDSWTEQDPGPPQSAFPVRLRVDTRRFAVALSPGANFILPLASSSVSVNAGTSVFNLEQQVEEFPMQEDLPERVPETPKGSAQLKIPSVISTSKIAEVKLATLTEMRAPSARPATEQPSLRRLLSCISLSAPSSQYKHRATNQVPPTQRTTLEDNIMQGGQSAVVALTKHPGGWRNSLRFASIRDILKRASRYERSRTPSLARSMSTPPRDNDFVAPLPVIDTSPFKVCLDDTTVRDLQTHSDQYTPNCSWAQSDWDADSIGIAV
ncbi:hypothetical protein AX15_001726 [Amanita polypyramis BW_CC]|nr:hypothetical protein AX15_001726 [Amanita polypyramis BW_CC]